MTGGQVETRGQKVEELGSFELKDKVCSKKNWLRIKSKYQCWNSFHKKNVSQGPLLKPITVCTKQARDEFLKAKNFTERNWDLVKVKIEKTKTRSYHWDTNAFWRSFQAWGFWWPAFSQCRRPIHILSINQLNIYSQKLLNNDLKQKFILEIGKFVKQMFTKAVMN